MVDALLPPSDAEAAASARRICAREIAGHVHAAIHATELALAQHPGDAYLRARLAVLGPWRERFEAIARDGGGR